MMYKITCDYCFEDHFFNTLENRPGNCSNCNSPIGHLVPVETSENDHTENDGITLRVPDGFILTYQKTNATIDIPHGEIIILGRQNAGNEVLANIPQISREHCKIEYFNGKYLLTDLNSLNGTFLGSSRRDCRKHMKQAIQDHDVIYLGRESFTVVIKYRASEEDEASHPANQEEIVIEARFKCRGCGKIHDMNLLICDNCGSYGQIELLEE